jgi:hypothetical protein
VSFADMRTTFQTILNRSDCSDAQATLFLQQAIQRIQRDCRLPSMERALFVTPTDVPMSFFVVPRDLIQPIDILVPKCDGIGSQPLTKLSYRELVGINPLIWPSYYARFQGVYQIRGNLLPGNQLQFLYYGNFTSFTSDADENELSTSTPDLAVYGALSYAADLFQHPASAAWEGRYQAIKAEVEQMGIDLDAEGGPSAVEPIYHWND